MNGFFCCFSLDEISELSSIIMNIPEVKSRPFASNIQDRVMRRQSKIYDDVLNIDKIFFFFNFFLGEERSNASKKANRCQGESDKRLR